MRIHARTLTCRFYCLILSSLFLAACQQAQPLPPAAPDYARPLADGSSSLVRIQNPSNIPALAQAFSQLADPAYRESLQKSLNWFDLQSTKQYFPTAQISHAHAYTSVYALLQVRKYSDLLDEFDLWQSVGWNNLGEVLFTAYYSPVFKASATRQGPYQYPLFKRPSDLRSNPNTGDVIGGYYTRNQLEQSGKLIGLELVYLPSRLDAYIIEVNGSAKLQMTDGSTRYVGYAGNNGHDYTSIGKLLAEKGVMSEHEINLSSIRAYFNQNPNLLNQYISRNDRFVFFKWYKPDQWPAGSLGVNVTPYRSLATDKSIFPRGCPMLITTTLPDNQGNKQPFTQLMVDQDTGGAIRAAGRADIYLGVGSQAEAIAGHQAATGQMYYLLLKPDRVQYWYDKMSQSKSAKLRSNITKHTYK
ncbi:Membrane-bound lytic murein transglycosylase A precursor [Poriferisphaera corsica]|uniref:peptidoglycan lytic exotransglycosylase n=1 Tax=Poriferisphaera corsica TaxID=2528020 RepID=A0A517YTQ5_9BACT|nr:MltA domain-containing protein [Poriferisphaera corsica]QDU33589.1 Membrane-bound lytic murein transglycosylase A precursor [Poriferisphaera corsica]